MTLQGKVYENTVVFLVACAILYASTLHPGLNTAVFGGLALFTAIAFLFLFFPPWERLTLFVVSIEFTILSVILAVNIDDTDFSCDLMTIAICSYIASNALLGHMVSLRGLTLKDMGIMGLIIDSPRAILNDCVAGNADVPDIETKPAITS